jgi:hypothetical protein
MMNGCYTNLIGECDRSDPPQSRLIKGMPKAGGIGQRSATTTVESGISSANYTKGRSG